MKKICLLVILLCGLIISSTASAADWVWIHSSNFGTFYVDNNSIRRDSKESSYVFHAFMKEIFTDAGRKNFIEDMRKQGNSGIQNVSYIVYLQYFKYDNGIKYHATSNIAFYESNGALIKQLSNNKLNWMIITSDTGNEIMFDNLRARVPN